VLDAADRMKLTKPAQAEELRSSSALRSGRVGNAMLEWHDVREAFEPDGMLLDVYVRSVDAAAWERAFAFLITEGAEYTVDGHAAAVPMTAAQALRLRPVGSPLMLVRRYGIEYACHFFSDSEIELDFWPEDVDGPEHFEALVRFVRGLGRASGQDVIVTPENCPESPLIRYAAREDEVVACRSSAE
jgi:hypothetical protein